MPARRPADFSARAAISVSEMAARCQLSRGRFHELIRAGVMPWPLYDLRTRRPLYTLELQLICKEIRETNIGIDGRYIIFYAPRTGERVSTARGTRQPSGDHADLLDGLRSLGMESVTHSQIRGALDACYPSGYSQIDEGERLRTVWQHLRRTNGG